MIEPSALFALESEASTSGSKRPAGKPFGKSSLMTSTGLCLPIDSLTHNNGETFVTGAHISCPPPTCIAGGTPCQDLSVMGNAARNRSQRGLSGNRSGLFFSFIDLVEFYRPQWVVWENVPAVLSSNDCRDFETVIQSFAKLGYVGHARVLNSQFFGVPQKRRRLYMVAGLGRFPHPEFLDDAAAVGSLSCAAGSSWLAKPADAWAGFTLTAPPKCSGASGHGRHAGRINLGSELFVAEEDGWDQMAERARAFELHGLRSGLDETNSEEAFAAGNAVVPAIAQWIAEILNRS